MRPEVLPIPCQALLWVLLFRSHTYLGTRELIEACGLWEGQQSLPARLGSSHAGTGIKLPLLCASPGAPVLAAGRGGQV